MNIDVRHRRLMRCEHRAFARRAIPTESILRSRPWLAVEDSPRPWPWRKWARMLQLASPGTLTIGAPMRVH